MDTKLMLQYLADLELNSNREWYHANKAQYAEAMATFEQLIQQIIWNVGLTDKSILHNDPKTLTFQLVRDTRFSHDKSPYNPTFRAHISSAGKLPIPVGYFLSISSGNRSFLGGGLFAGMFKDATSMVRDYIASHGEEFESIITNEDFRKHFSVKGESLKKVPKVYDSDFSQAEYLKNKSWYLEYPITDDLLLNSDNFVEEATRIFELMQPFNNYLNKALKQFVMPEKK